MFLYLRAKFHLFHTFPLFVITYSTQWWKIFTAKTLRSTYHHHHQFIRCMWVCRVTSKKPVIFPSGYPVQKNFAPLKFAEYCSDLSKNILEYYNHTPPSTFFITKFEVFWTFIHVLNVVLKFSHPLKLAVSGYLVEKWPTPNSIRKLLPVYWLSTRVRLA